MPTASEILTRYGVKARTATMELMDAGEQRGRKIEIRDGHGNRRFEDRVGPPSKDEAEWDGVMREQRLQNEAVKKQEEDEARRDAEREKLKRQNNLSQAPRA